MSWEDDLRKQYSYCKNIELIPFPSAIPEFFVGYAIWCNKNDEEVDVEKCKTCKEEHWHDYPTRISST